MADPIYVVTGATGHVGAIVAERLLAEKRRLRVVGRDPAKLEAFKRRGAEVAIGSIDDAGFLRRAFEGAAAAFVLLPPNMAARPFRAWQDKVAGLIGDALESTRVRNVVTLSSIGAHRPGGNGPIAGLHTLEQRLDKIAGANVLHLRPGYFFENNLASVGMIKGTGTTGGMLRPDLKMSHIATRDIGEVAARRLAALDWTGHQVQELHGQRELTMAEVAAALGKVIGKPDLKYIHFSYEDGKKGLASVGLPPEWAELYADMSRGFNEGHIAATQPRTAASTTPSSIEWFAEAVFAPAFRA